MSCDDLLNAASAILLYFLAHPRGFRHGILSNNTKMVKQED